MQGNETNSEDGNATNFWGNSSLDSETDWSQFEQYVPRKDLFKWLISPAALVFQSICICANVVIFFFVCSFRTYRSPANYLLANLCLVSTLFISNVLLLNFEHRYQLFTYGPYACILASFVHRLPLPLMTLAIMALSVDRSRIARNPLNHPSRWAVLAQILAVWALSFLLTLPRAMSSEFIPETTMPYKCRKVPFLHRRWAQAVYALLNFLGIYGLPAIRLIKELRKTWKQMKYVATCQGEQSTTGSFARRSRLMRNSCIFTGIFVTCWLPLGIIMLPYDWVSPYHVPWLWMRLMRDFFWNIVVIQACVNPLLVQLLSLDLHDLFTSCVHNM